MKIPFIIMVMPAVAQFKRDQLVKDGAIIMPIEPLTLGHEWIKVDEQPLRWQEQMSKLHLFKMEQYDRILYVDSDTILQRPLDPIFAAGEPNTTVRRVGDNKDEIMSDEGELPEEYLLASIPEVWGTDYSYPPTSKDFTVSPTSIQGDTH